jgi:hypothetical protein
MKIMTAISCSYAWHVIIIIISNNDVSLLRTNLKIEKRNKVYESFSSINIC